MKPGSEKQFFFQLRHNEEGTSLFTVDAKGQCTTPPPRAFQGEQGVLLKAIEAIRRSNIFNISWGNDDDRGVSIDAYPHLMYNLIKCDNIRDEDMQPIAVAKVRATAVLSISAPENGRRKGVWKLRIDTPETDDAADVELPFKALTENFILLNHCIYETDPLGENYRNLQFFASEFAERMTDQYLSVVYSYVSNFLLDMGGARVTVSREEVAPEPTIVFEKVDSDMALHIRVTSSIEGIDEEFLNRFELSHIADTDAQGNVRLRPLLQFDSIAAIDEIDTLIVKNANSRKEARDVYRDDNLFIIPQYVAGPFLFRALPNLIHSYRLLGTDKLKEYKVAPVKPRLSMKFASGIDFLEGTATIEVGDRTMSLGELFEQYRRDRYVTLSDGTRAVIDSGYMKKLQRIFGDKRGAGKKVKVGYFDLPDIEELLTEKLDSKIFERQREVYEGFNHLAESQLTVPGLQATLRHYQSEGVKWIRYLYDNNLNGCLADDMGLGKTIQTIAMLSIVYSANPDTPASLIVMPRSLIFNWQQELQRFNPELSVYTYYSNSRDIDEARRHNIILTTYAMVRNDIAKFRDAYFHYVILDESQNIKNIEAQTTRAIYLLKADHRLALSGTPLENNLTELFSLFRFLNPGMLGDIEEFNRRYGSPIMHDNDKEASASLRRRIYPFMLRRLKKDVLTELPDRVEQTLYVEMSSEQAEFYEQRRSFYYSTINETIATAGIKKSQFVMFQALTELRRIASVPESLTDGRIRSPKLDDLIDRLSEAVANGHKCVVFYNYIAGLELTGERLTALNIDYETMTGATINRRKVIERFNKTPECMVLLMTLKTGGVGLNLTAADTVFIFEPWWNKAAEEQAINRLHRIGQTAKVLAYSLIARDTIEEKILRLQQQKTQLFDNLISADTATSKVLSVEDINYILG